MRDVFEELGFLDAEVSSIQSVGSDVTATFSERESPGFQLQFSGVVFLQYHLLTRIEDWTLCDKSVEIDAARDFMSRADWIPLAEACLPLNQLTLFDTRNLPMFQIVFRDCQLVAGG